VAELSIKVTIASRVYPLSIQDTEEEKIREAAGVINELIKNFETKYAVKDKQDLLAMCALQFATQKLNVEKKDTTAEKSVSSDLQELEDFIDGYLEEH
jgi:cell division protein ZapA